MKPRRWTTTKLTAVGSLGVLLLFLQLIPVVINTIAPARFYSGFLSTLIHTSIAIICLMIINKFGSASLMFAIYGFLAIPFNILGTPGFLLKIPITLGIGIISDVLYSFLKRNKLVASLLIGGTYPYYFVVVMTFVAEIYNIPGFEGQKKLLFTPFIVFGSIILGAIEGYVGYIIYQKIKNTSIVKRIQK
jgi:hypothetical protein